MSPPSSGSCAHFTPAEFLTDWRKLRSDGVRGSFRKYWGGSSEYGSWLVSNAIYRVDISTYICWIMNVYLVDIYLLSIYLTCDGRMLCYEPLAWVIGFKVSHQSSGEDPWYIPVKIKILYFLHRKYLLYSLKSWQFMLDRTYLI